MGPIEDCTSGHHHHHHAGGIEYGEGYFRQVTWIGGDDGGQQYGAVPDCQPNPGDDPDLEHVLDEAVRDFEEGMAADSNHNQPNPDDGPNLEDEPSDTILLLFQQGHPPHHMGMYHSFKMNFFLMMTTVKEQRMPTIIKIPPTLHYCSPKRSSNF